MTQGPGGDPAALAAHLAAVQGAGVSLDRGVAVLPFAQLAHTAIDPRIPLLVTHLPTEGSAAAQQVGTLPGRSGAGWALLARIYGVTHEVVVLPSGARNTLEALAAVPAHAGAALLLPPLPPLAALTSPWAMPWLSARLRAEDGCPWDREQTHGSLAKHLIEESWELHDAIQSLESAPEAQRGAAYVALAEELGDVLLQVVLHAQLAEEAGAFDFTDVQERLAKKIVRRHPHVFGDGVARNTRDVQRSWETIKAEERAASAAAAPASTRPKGALDGVSRSLPALMASRELQDRASSVGYDWPTLDGVREKIVEEIAELDEALATAGNPDLITAVPATSPESLAAAQDELGDVLAVLVNLGRRSGIDAEAALRGANDKFRRRFGEVERLAAVREITLNTADFATLDGLWDEAKAAERAGELRG